MEEDNDDNWLKEAEVMSEVHLGCDPSLGSDISVFAISYFPAFTEDGNTSIQDRERNLVEKVGDSVAADENRVGTDKHGDLILPRRRGRRELAKITGDYIRVHHHLSTRLPDVGLQIWKGALLLSDFILHEMNKTERFEGAVAIELGAGTGLVGLIMARYAGLVFITDRGTDILDNCTRNVISNATSLKHGEASVRVRELDWHKPWPPENKASSGCDTAYNWTLEDINISEKASVFLAADVVYSPELTDAFFYLMKKLMPLGSEKVLYLAMEKRYNFTITDQQVVAHDYKHFRSFFTTDSKEENCEEDEVDADSHGDARHFKGTRINVHEVRQYVMNYDRGNDLELWELRSKDS